MEELVEVGQPGRATWSGNLFCSSQPVGQGTQSGTDERLLAFTRELCALKLSEREALRRLGVAQRRFDAAQVASGELRVANDRLEKQLMVEAAEAAERAWTAERAETQERHDAAVAELKEEHVAMLEAAQEEFASKLREELESAEFRARHDVRTAMEESLTNTVDDLSAKSAAAEARAEAAEKAHSQLLTMWVCRKLLTDLTRRSPQKLERRIRRRTTACTLTPYSCFRECTLTSTPMLSSKWES